MRSSDNTGFSFSDANTIADVRQRIVSLLKSVGVEDAETRREADLIVEYVTGKTVAQQMCDSDRPIATGEKERLEEVCRQRQKRVPLQYIMGYTWFMGLRFQVNPAVLIPRADTEILVETTIELFKARDMRAPLFEDVGTGSGAIAVSLLCRLTEARAVAIDISQDALEVAKENARLNGVAQRFQPVLADWHKRQPDVLVDAVISNPPYIPLSMKAELQPEVGVYEPMSALIGLDEDGLGFYRALSRRSSGHLKPGGFLVVEVGQGQAPAVAEIFRNDGWCDVSSAADLGGIMRVVSAFRADSGY